MAKRLSRQQKEDIAKAALLRRVTDIYSGAIGEVPDEDYFATAPQLENIVCAIRQTFLDQVTQGVDSWMWKPHVLRYYENPTMATSFLFEHGIRA